MLKIGGNILLRASLLFEEMDTKCKYGMEKSALCFSSSSYSTSQTAIFRQANSGNALPDNLNFVPHLLRFKRVWAIPLHRDGFTFTSSANLFH